MLIDFNTIKEITVPGMNNGTGSMTDKMYMDERGKIIPCTIHPGGSIGIHQHTASDDINYVLSGMGKTICDDKGELLNAGCCHICKCNELRQDKPKRSVLPFILDIEFPHFLDHHVL